MYSINAPALWRKVSRLPQVLLLALAIAATPACVSTGTFQSARTLEAGQLEFQVAPNYGTLTILGTTDTFMVPYIQTAIRYGISGNADFGVHLGIDGLNFDTKFQLVRNDKVAVALAPSLGGFFIGGAGGGGGYVTYQLPLIIGMMLGPNSELSFAPKVAGFTVFGTGGGESASGTILVPAISIGLDQELTRTFRIHPELSLGYGILTGGASTGQSGSEQLGARFNLGIGFSFGGALARGQQAK